MKKSLLLASLLILQGCVITPAHYEPEARHYYYNPYGEVVFINPGVVVPVGVHLRYDRGWYMHYRR